MFNNPDKSSLSDDDILPMESKGKNPASLPRRIHNRHQDFASTGDRIHDPSSTQSAFSPSTKGYVRPPLSKLKQSTNEETTMNINSPRSKLLQQDISSQLQTSVEKDKLMTTAPGDHVIQDFAGQEKRSQFHSYVKLDQTKQEHLQYKQASSNLLSSSDPSDQLSSAFESSSKSYEDDDQTLLSFPKLESGIIVDTLSQKFHTTGIKGQMRKMDIQVAVIYDRQIPGVQNFSDGVDTEQHYRIEANLTLRITDPTKSQCKIVQQPPHIIYRKFEHFEWLRSQTVSLLGDHPQPIFPVRSVVNLKSDDNVASEKEGRELEIFLRSIVSATLQPKLHDLENEYMITESMQPLMSFLDDKSSSFHLKIKCAILETRLFEMTETIRALRDGQARSSQTIESSQNIIQSFERKLEKMENFLKATISDNEIVKDVTQISTQREISMENNETRDLRILNREDLKKNYSQLYSKREGQYEQHSASKISNNLLTSQKNRENVGTHARKLADHQSVDHEGQRNLQTSNYPWLDVTQQHLMTETHSLISHGTKTANFLPIHLIPSSSNATILDSCVEEILNLIKPSPDAERNRISIFSFISQQIKLALGAQCFPIGAFALKVYLPDDKIEITSILSQVRENAWFIKVNEALCKLNSESTDSKEQRSLFPHIISNINVVSCGESRTIRCSADQVVVDLSANYLCRLCEAAFLEHFDLLLGKQHLFKRSFLLLKAWCIYESSIGFSESSGDGMLSDFAIATMLIAVINRHFRTLHWPIQVIAAFFSAYNNFEWSTHCITLEGILPTNTLGYQNHRDSQVDNLIPVEMISTYRMKYPSQSPDDNASAASVKIRDILNAPPSIESNKGSSQFKVGIMNVMNPLNNRENLISTLTSEQYRNRVSKMIDSGALELKSLLHTFGEVVKSNGNQISSPQYQKFFESFEYMFSKTLARFSHGWRPDVPQRFKNSALMHNLSFSYRGDHLDGNYKQLWENFQFGTFILENEVTSSALIKLAVSVLTERGPIPVGEVGKMLQEATSNPHLSQILKEQFNGLKKFLEKYPDKFLISNDHPFNPTVFLRSRFTEEEQVLIETGSSAFMNSLKKNKKSRRKSKGVSYISSNTPDSPHPR